MAKYFFTTVFSFFIIGISAAQQTGRMETDRPDQTESPVITKKNYIQAEWGFNIERDNKLKTFVHPTVLWKFGASTRFEFRLITESITQETPLFIPVGNDFISGILPIQLGGKISLWEEKGLLPKTSFIFHVAPSKFGSKKFHTDKWSPNFRFTMNHTLSETVGLGYNIGAEWDGFSNTPSWVYTLAPGFNIGKNGYGYVEAFGSITKNQSPSHALDAGLAYYFSDNSKIDFSSGIGLSEAATDWYCAIGYSFRFNVGKK
jgi:hypothetical protein